MDWLEPYYQMAADELQGKAPGAESRIYANPRWLDPFQRPAVYGIATRDGTDLFYGKRGKLSRKFGGPDVRIVNKR